MTAAPAAERARLLEAVARLDVSGLPSDFSWGTTTSAFCVEGAADARGASIWDEHCARPGRVADGSDGRVAADHVGRLDTDVALLAGLRADTYRFSVAWPRVLPDGTGAPSPDGLAFYDRLVDGLLGAGIRPWATLYRWDLPATLQASGGWASRDVVEAFADYATSVHAALGDRVATWTTLDDPWSAAWLGYGDGRHAPGVTDPAQAVRAAHHLLLAHGAALARMRAQAPADHRFGIGLALANLRPAAGVGPDVAHLVDGLHHRWWLDALLLGAYPDDLLPVVASWLDEPLEDLVLDGDLDLVAQPLDLLDVGWDGDLHLEPADEPADGAADGSSGEAGSSGSSGAAGALPYPVARSVRVADPGDRGTATGRPVTPRGLVELLVGLGAERPVPPLVVTTGAAYDDDLPDADGVVEDPERVAFLLEHVDAVAAAVRAGADVRGLVVRSFLDGVEWTDGWTCRQGLVRVERAGLERRTRRSYDAFRAVAEKARGRRTARH